MATFHIESKKEDIAQVVLMPGDPLRAKYIADKYLTNVKMVNSVRNMFAYTGFYKDTRVTVFASGMGIPSIGIYSYELYKFYDVKKIIRIGTAGSFSKDIKLRDIILSTGSYSLSTFPYLLAGDKVSFVESSLLLNEKIRKKALTKNIFLKVGKTITSDVFNLYCIDHQKFLSNFQNDNYLAVEMEAFGLFYIAKLLQKEAACLITIVDSLYDKGSLTSEDREKSLDEMITLALEACVEKEG